MKAVMSIILTPYWVAEECFLVEALMWAGFHRYPKSEIIPDQVDFRFDKDQLDDYQPRIIDDHGYVDSDESVRVGLKPNPEWENLLADEDGDAYLYSDPVTIEKMLTLNLPKEEKKKYEKALPLAKKRKQEQDDWDAEYEEHIEIIEAKLFVALKEGTLKSFGRPVTLNKDDCHDYGEHEEISASFWRQDSIDWNQSASENKKGHFCHIYVETNKLFELFPAPIPEKETGVSLIAGQYLLDNDATPKAMKFSKRGRPSFDWDSFYLEITDRVKKDDLPDKQEALIAEMQAWCLEHWGRKVARSTLVQKVSPFHKKYVRK